MENTKTVKSKRTTFRMDDSEYERVRNDAAFCGMDLSSYIRSRVTHDIDRVFFDPSMVEELRAYRQEIRSLVQEVEQVRRRIDRDNYIQNDELRQLQGLVKSVYRKMASVEAAVDRYREEAITNGNNKTFKN